MSTRLSSRWVVFVGNMSLVECTDGCQIPFNNACSTHNNSMLTNLNITGLKVEMAKDTNRHVKKTLPPSLSGFPGMADIKYYLKATVIRPQFYKENIRVVWMLAILKYAT